MNTRVTSSQQTHRVLWQNVGSIIWCSTKSTANDPGVKYQWQATGPQWLVLGQHWRMVFVQSTERCFTAVNITGLATKQWCEFLMITQHSRISHRLFKCQTITITTTNLFHKCYSQNTRVRWYQIHQRHQLPVLKVTTISMVTSSPFTTNHCVFPVLIQTSQIFINYLIKWHLSLAHAFNSSTS